MSDRLVFEVPGRPVPYTRQTHRSKGVRRQARRYNQYKARVEQHAFVAAQKQGWERPAGDGSEPVAIDVDIYLEKGPWADGDNIFKAILDGIQPGVIPDDRVTHVRRGNFQCIFDEGEKVVVQVQRISQD